MQEMTHCEPKEGTVDYGALFAKVFVARLSVPLRLVDD